MRALLSAWGTRGDVQPLLAVGAHLVRRGGAALALVPERWAEAARALGLEAEPMPDDPVAAVSSPEAARAIAAGSVQSVLDAVMRAAVAASPAWCAAIERRLAEHDVLVAGGPMAPASAAVAASHGRPALVALGYPHRSASFGGPSGTASGFLEPWRPLLRERLEADGRRGVLAILRERGVRVLYAWSAALEPAPEAGDPAPVGHPTMPAGSSIDPPLPASIDAWLTDGPPPVLVTTGSMPAMHEATSPAAIARALDLRGERPLVVGAALSGVTTVARADLDALMPRCRAVVHHGGAGTVHAALRAGRPSLAVAMMLDQLAWGRALELHRAGVLVRAGARGELVERALDRMLSPAVAAGAEELGARVRADDASAAILRHLDALTSAS